MQKNILLAVAVSLSVFGFAQEYQEGEGEQHSGQAPQEVINLAFEACETWAVADDIPEPELQEYLRSCVDDELVYHGYQPLTDQKKSI